MKVILYVFFFYFVDGSESKAIVQYIVLFNNILHRVRYNKFSRIVNEELDSKCGAVLDGLLSNGRLTLGQFIERDRGES
jgi:DNA-directed RNA polymerase III subunit RPC3